MNHAAAHARRSVDSPGWPVSVGIVVLAAALTFYALSYPLNHDVGWFLHVAGAVLGGESLYTSIIEVNPPLFTYFCMVPVLVESVTGWPIEPVFEVIVLMICFGMITWAASLVLRGSERRSGYLLPSVLGGWLVAFLAIPGMDFGQREHLMMMLTTPYVVVLWRRMDGAPAERREAVVAGLVAGLGFSLKPHYAVLWGALELLWLASMLRQDSRAEGGYLRPSAIAGAFVGGVYVLAVAAIHPEYFRLLARSASLYESFADRARIGLIGVPYSVAALAGVLAVLRTGEGLLRLARIYLVLMVAGVAIVVLQGKGWGYHHLPAQASLVVLAGLTTGHLVCRLRTSAAVQLTTVASLVLLAAAGWSIVANLESNTAERQARLETLGERAEFFEEIPGRQSVLMLSDLVSDAFPLVHRQDLVWTAPFPSTWWLQARYERTRVSPDQFRRLAAITGIERELSNRLVESFVERRPDYVLIDTVAKPYYGGVPFPYLAYFGQWPEFRDTRYERVGSLDKFTVWRRTD